MRFCRPTKRNVITASALYALNLFDMVATAYAVTKGYAMELNPIMRMLMEAGMGYFILFKVAFVLVLASFLLFIPFSRQINTILVFLTGAYAAIGLMHILIFLGQNGQ